MAKKKPTRPERQKSTSRKTGKLVTDDGPDFENSLAEVERIVAGLESGELDLTESLQQYETGIKQLKRCHAMLDSAEQKVSLLSGFDADGNPITEPIDVSSQRSGTGRSATLPARSKADSSGFDRDGDSMDGEAALF